MGSSRTIIFIGLKMSRIILEVVLDCIFGAMSGCRACVCFEVWERVVELFGIRWKFLNLWVYLEKAINYEKMENDNDGGCVRGMDFGCGVCWR